MGDQGFDFGPPSETRDARQFEPPPWEREQFDRLARQRAEELAAEQAARGPVVEMPAVHAAIAGEQPADERQIAAMMDELKAEEPSTYGGVWVAATMSAIVLGAVGLVLIVWGVTAAARPNAGLTGAIGAGILLLFGLGFGGLGAWLAFRTMRQQGVL